MDRGSNWIQHVSHNDVRDYYRLHVAQRVPKGSISAFIADAYAHNMAYASGVDAAFGLTDWILYRRNKRKTLENSSF